MNHSTSFPLHLNDYLTKKNICEQIPGGAYDISYLINRKLYLFNMESGCYIVDTDTMKWTKLEISSNLKRTNVRAILIYSSLILAQLKV